ncbi:MAG TPA: chitobiase/beta-hexosaminidase C-terminal domain-containing protein [Candidatus Sulfotelmatobacter sp.]|nr:chitobiase/beta-hexosaminidase C-terminal domain-containing protein [Candidatus Sulfotelmatobacter sp.]
MLRHNLPPFILAGIILLTFAGISSAATIIMNGSDAAGTNSFKTGLHWTGGAAPSPGNAYQTGTNLLRTPTNSASVTFAGDSLEIQSNGELRINSTAIVTVRNLILDTNSLLTLTAPTGGNTATLAGTNVTLKGISFIRSGIQTGESGEVFTNASPFNGTGGFNTAGCLGTIIFTATNNFSGGATVNGGTVLVNGIFSASSVTVANGTLGGHGIIAGSLTNLPGGIVQPGLGNGDTSTLTVYNNVILAGTNNFTLNRNNSPNITHIVSGGVIAMGGTLNITNAGAALQAGDFFTLFYAGGLAAGFSTINLPPLDSGLVWTNTLGQDGSISVISAGNISTSGVWISDANSLWSAATNWANGNIANGTGSNADFSTINLTADRIVTLDSSRTIGNLLFADVNGSQNWFLNASNTASLTLAVNSGSPLISVSNNSTTISVPLAGNQGLTVTGGGILTLSGTNTFTGDIVVTNGNLLLTGSLADGAVVADSATLAGNGIIAGALTNLPGGTVQPGRGNGDTSTLTVYNNVILAGTNNFTLNRNNSPNITHIVSGGVITMGGTLNVTNTGAALQAGDYFALFYAGGLAGGFSIINLPPLASGLAWTNTLAQDGSISVINAGNSTPPGTWISDANGLWSAATNWANGSIANGTGGNADFSTINLTADRTVTLDSSRTIGNLLFADVNGSKNWFLNASNAASLTLAVNSNSPAIIVSNNFATVGVPLAGNQGLTVTGGGTLTLSGTNTFSGKTIVTNGNLLLTGSLADGAVVANGATLAGNGTIAGTLTNLPGGTVQPGLGNGDTSTLNVYNNVILDGTNNFTLNRNYSPNIARIISGGVIIMGGTLNVTNTGAALQAGDTFILFYANGLAGGFSTFNLPPLASGLAWTNQLLPYAMISVFSTIPPTNPVVSNLPATQMSTVSAALNGQVLSTGGLTPNVWIYYGPVNGGTNAAAWSNNIALGAQTGAFTTTASSLSANTTYYFTTFASNSAGIFWGQPALSFTTPAASPPATRVPVLTYHYDNTRQGQNTNETLLTPSDVNTNTFGKLFTYAVDGFVYTEPLIMTNLTIPGQGVHNVVFVATEHDTVYAFDADSNAGANSGLLWSTNLGVSALDSVSPIGRRYSGVNNPYSDIAPEVGATGTPVIDPTTGTLYVDAFTREVTGSATNFVHRIHALDVTTGNERSYSPVVVAGFVPGTGVDSSNGVMTFNPMQSIQRAALTLAGGQLFVAYAGYGDTDPYHGWLFGYNATNLALATNYVFNTTPNATTNAFGVNAGEGGIWQGGGGLCVDANTNLYFETGNGSFSANTNGGDYSDSIMKISTTNGFAIADYFTAYDQASLAAADLDLSSCGPLLLPDSAGSLAHPHLLAGLGKSGKMYILDRDALASPHYQPGGDSQILQSFNATANGIWAPPVYFNGNIYVQPSSAPMQQFSISNAVVNTTSVATAPVSLGSFNGGPVVSANGTSNGIIWVLNSAAFQGGGPGVLYAFNATNISQMLYNSSQILARDNPGGAMKMTTPTVAGGKVYVPAQYALSVYGLQGFIDAPVIAPDGGNFVNSVTITITDNAAGASIYYTLDGTTPTAGSTLYTAPFVLTSNAVVSAVAIQAGAVNSAVTTASFVNTAGVGSGTGLQAQYFSNANSMNPFFGSPVLVTTNATVIFSSTTGWPGATVGTNHFTVRWTGSVQPQFTENYSFVITADDGVRLFINGQQLINDWMDKTNATSSTNSLALVAQQLYTIELDYYQKTSNAAVSLAWSSPSTPLQVVPQTQLYPFTNPPPTVVLTAPSSGASYTATASVTLTADADAPYNPVSAVSFYANTNFLGSVTNAPYTITATGLGQGSYSLAAVATDASGLSSTSAVVNVTVNAASGQPYGLTNYPGVNAFLNMPSVSAGIIPPLLSLTGVFSNTPSMAVANGLIGYTPNTPLWSDGAIKTRYFAVPNIGGLLIPGEQIGFTPTNSWTFPAGTVFVKTFALNTDTSNPNVIRRLETRLLVRDINGAVYGVTYKWRADNSDADLLSSSLSENILVTNATGVSTQTWYYPSPSDCLTCHTPVANYVLGVNARQLNGNYNYAASGVTDNQLRTLNHLGLFNPAFDESVIPTYPQMASLTNLSAPLEQRARSYFDANCAQCHQPGGSGITFDARYPTPLAAQNITNYPAAFNLGYDNACIVKSQDVWRSMIWQRINTTTNSIKMPPLARNLIDTNAVAVISAWINSLGGTPAEAPPNITPGGGNYYSTVGVTLTAPDTNAVIYYTLDGSLPTTNSLHYSGTFNLATNATIAASAWRTNYNNSIAANALFFITPVQFASANFTTNRQFQLNFLGSAGSNYVLQATTNFVNWTALSTNTATTNSFPLLDPKATNFPYRFYRVLQQ